MQAVKILKELYPNISLHIVGSGPEQNNLEKLCSELGLEDTVHFCGHLSNREAMEEMAQAQFFIMPSSPEGFGIVYLEAMASGCVTIGIQGEGISDFIIDGENGYLVPLDDVDAIVLAVKNCLEDRQLLEKIATKGKLDANRQTWSKNADEYSDLFNELVKQI